MRFIILLLLLGVSQAVKNVPASYKPPGGLDPQKVPQFVMFTTDDNCKDRDAQLMTDITRKIKNPNGCTAGVGFFCTSTFSSCKTMKRLHAMGHEIAVHSKTHQDMYEISSSERKEEIVGARDYIVNTCGIPGSDVKGWRSPYLSSGPSVRNNLKNNGYLYDSSIPEVYPSPTSPSSSKRLWPYSMYQGVKQAYSDEWFDGIARIKSDEKYDKLFEIPMNQYQDGNDSPSTDDLMDPKPNTYKALKAELDRNYKNNRAPMGVWVHTTTTGYMTNSKYRDEVAQFLEYAASKPDVWIVTPRQVVDWMQNPVPASKMDEFMAKYPCPSGKAY